MVTLEDILAVLNSGGGIEKQSTEWRTLFHNLCQEAIRIGMELNCAYHTEEELVEIMSRLTGRPVDPALYLFPPLYTDFGKNLHIGHNVFINSGCHFQDQGGIYIGDHTLIGHSVVFATINHALEPEKNRAMSLKPIHIGNHVWIGSHATILSGVTIGDWAVVAAGALVRCDVPACTVVGGVPAKILRRVDPAESPPFPD